MNRNAQYFTPANVALVNRREMARRVEQPVERYNEPLEEMPFGLKVFAGVVCAVMLMFAMAVFMLI